MVDESIAVSHRVIDLLGREKRLEICIGDIVACRGQAVDFLALSAFPDDYLPIPGALIARLADAGIVVSDLAREKERDWRHNWGCWLSMPVTGAGEPIGRIVCFEHGTTVNPANAVGNVFRTIRENLMEDDGRRAKLIRVPLLSTGDQGHDRLEMMRAILRQAWIHLMIVDRMEKIQLFLLPGAPDLGALLVNAGMELEKIRSEFMLLGNELSYDYFISYRQVDSTLKDELVKVILTRQPSAKIFVDAVLLQHGSYWKAELVRGMRSSRKAICLATDTYPGSPECMDEFHMAVSLNDHRDGFLVPLLSLENKDISHLPVSMTRIHWAKLGSPPELPSWAWTGPVSG